MSEEKNHKEKSRMHPRNKNRERYDLAALIKAYPNLSQYLKPNKLGEDSIDFLNPVAVKLLNQALLKHYYGINNWVFPDENLTPPIPGRADYIHYMADLLAEKNFGEIPQGTKIICYDIGIGASCIYPIIGVSEYNWNFIGSDIDPKSIGSANNIVSANPSLKDKIDCRLQKNPRDVFYGVISREDKIDLSICNPPYHATVEEAKKGSRRKIKNLTGKEEKNPILNFSGINKELVTEGGEYKFIHNMLRESKKYEKNFFWFSTLVSKQSNLKSVFKALKKFEASQIRTIPMGTGNKSSRIVAWTFLSKEEQLQWSKSRWKK